LHRVRTEEFMLYWRRSHILSTKQTLIHKRHRERPRRLRRRLRRHPRLRPRRQLIHSIQVSRDGMVAESQVLVFVAQKGSH
jgi:hypothetical protein